MPINPLLMMGAESALSGLNSGPAGPSFAETSAPWEQGAWTVALGGSSATGADCPRDYLPYLLAALALVILWKKT